MPAPPIECRRYDLARLGQVRDLLLDVYAEVYADRLGEPFFTVDRFAERLDGHVRAPHWEAVVGYAAGQPVGYAYGATRPAGSTAWQGVHPRPDPELARETGTRTFFLFELMVRTPWRKTGGAAATIHEDLLRQRREERVSLTVEHDHPKVRARYERWGYQHVGSVRPYPDAPLLDVMLRTPISPPPRAAPGPPSPAP
jgi:GNAT superfamily N-acetyltransferase